MSKNYMVCFAENIENRINDDDVLYDGDMLNQSVDCVFDVFAENEDDAKEQYLRMCAKKAYAKKEGIALIKRECAARVIRRIVFGQLLQLPREVIVSEQIDRMLTIVYDAVTEVAKEESARTTAEIFRHLANAIDMDEYANLLDENAIVSLYVELYKKDVFAQELKCI